MQRDNARATKVSGGAWVLLIASVCCGGTGPANTGGMGDGGGGGGGHGGTPAAAGSTQTGGAAGMGGVATGGHSGGHAGASFGGAAGGNGGTSTGGNPPAGGGKGGNSGNGGKGGAGASTGGTAGAGGGPSTATLLVDLARAFCAAASSCCQKKGLPTTLSDCESQFPSRLFGLDYVKRGTETIDNAALSRCTEGYKATSLSCAYQPLEAACKGVFVGTKAEGAPCGRGGTPSTSGSGECRATGRATMCLWTGDSNLSTTTGICQTPAHGKKGDPCASSCAKNDDCVFDLFTSPGYPTAICFEEDGLTCSSGPSSVCVTLTPTGGSCDADPFSCASTDFCDHSDTVASCRKGATLGEDCGSGSGQPQCLQGMSLSCGTSSKCEDLGLAFETTCRGTPTFP